MKNILMISKNDSQENMSLANDIKHVIEDHGGKASTIIEPVKDVSEPLEIPEDTECILTIGGDGALIRAAQRTFGSNIPLLGVNRGHLGYLCDLDEDLVYDAISHLFKEEYEVEERMLLEGAVSKVPFKKGKQQELFLPEIQPTNLLMQMALNDIVISSMNVSQVIQITIYVNHKKLYTFNGDGVIFSTPTGSTAYNLSANGPVVDPKAELILITPINPHTLNSRSIVLDSADEIAAEITPRRSSYQETALVSFDGNNQKQLTVNDVLIVRKSVQKTKMIRLTKENFLERISRKLMGESVLQ